MKRYTRQRPYLVSIECFLSLIWCRARCWTRWIKAVLSLNKKSLLPRFLILLVKLKKFDGSNYQKVNFFYSYRQLSENRIGKLLVNRGIRTRGLSHEYQFSVLLWLSCFNSLSSTVWLQYARIVLIRRLAYRWHRSRRNVRDQRIVQLFEKIHTRYQNRAA